jgi:hypothetical protein
VSATRDVVLRVPQGRWLNWLAEGDLPGDLPGDEPTETWAFGVGCVVPDLPPGSRCYVMAFGKVRGYAPVAEDELAAGAFLRRGGAVAVTVPWLQSGRGQWCWRYRFWEREQEVPFPAWATDGLPDALRAHVERLLKVRQDPDHRAALKRRALAGATAPSELFRGMPR